MVSSTFGENNEKVRFPMMNPQYAREAVLFIQLSTRRAEEPTYVKLCFRSALRANTTALLCMTGKYGGDTVATTVYFREKQKISTPTLRQTSGSKG